MNNGSLIVTATESLVDGYIVDYAEPVATEHHGGYTVQTYAFVTESL